MSVKAACGRLCCFNCSKNEQLLAAYLPCGLQKVIHRFAPALFTRNVDKPGDPAPSLLPDPAYKSLHFSALSTWLLSFLFDETLNNIE